MSEPRHSYALPKPISPAKLLDVGRLSEAEQEVVLLMRRVAAQSPRPLIILEQLGDAWRLHCTAPSKWIKT